MLIVSILKPVMLCWLALLPAAKSHPSSPIYTLPTPEQLGADIHSRILKTYRSLLADSVRDREILEKRTDEDNRQTIELMRKREADLRQRIEALEQRMQAPPVRPILPIGSPPRPLPKPPVRD